MSGADELKRLISEYLDDYFGEVSNDEESDYGIADYLINDQKLIFARRYSDVSRTR